MKAIAATCLEYGAPRKIRTSDRSVRSRVTARFVAEYSIQLSYGCIGLLQILFRKLLKEWCTQEDSNFRPLGS